MFAYVVYARIFGVVSLILALGILFNLDHAKQMAQQMIQDATGYIMGGVLPVIFGSWVVIEHNVWISGWPLVVTVIGWFMLLIGAYRLWFVKSWTNLLQDHYDKVPVLFALFGLILGLLLSYVGFVSHHWPTGL